MDDIFATIAVVVMLGLLTAIAFIFGSCADKKDIEAWNGGYHESCGGKWEYEQAVGHGHDTDYIYVCDKCGMRHEFEDVR